MVIGVISRCVAQDLKKNFLALPYGSSGAVDEAENCDFSSGLSASSHSKVRYACSHTEPDPDGSKGKVLVDF